MLQAAFQAVHLATIENHHRAVTHEVRHQAIVITETARPTIATTTAVHLHPEATAEATVPHQVAQAIVEADHLEDTEDKKPHNFKI